MPKAASKPVPPAQEFERIVTSYLGGELRDGNVPVGAKLVGDAGAQAALVAHLATKGFTLTFEKHEGEAALVVAVLKALPPPPKPAAPAPIPPAPPAPAPAPSKES